MHFSNVTRTALLTASTALNHSSNSVTSSPLQHTTSSPHPHKPWFSHPISNVTWPWWFGRPLSNSTWDPIDEPPSTPVFFLYNEKPVEDYFDEPALRTCTRKAIQLAGRERYGNITTEEKHPHAKAGTAWKHWVHVNSHDSLKNADDNRDGNTVDGLTDYVISSALEKNASLDRNTADKATCATLVELFAGAHLLDEILRAWGWREGILTKPSLISYKPGHNRSSPIERRHAAAYVASTYGNGTGQIVYPGNSSTLVIKHDENNFPLSITAPEKKTGIHFKWGVLNNFTIGNSTVFRWPIVITQIPLHDYEPSPFPSPKGSTLLGRSTRPFNSTRQPGWGWVPVPAVNLTSGPGSSLNYTDRFNNSAGIGLPSWRWVPIPINANSSVVEGVPEFLDGVARLYSCPVNSTGPVYVLRILNGVARMILCPGNSTLPSGALGRFTGPRKSTSLEGLSHPQPPISVSIDVHVPGHELLSAFDKFEEILAILDSGRNLTNHGSSNGSLGPRSKVHSGSAKGVAILEKILDSIFGIIGKVNGKLDGKHGDKHDDKHDDKGNLKSTPNGRRVARGSLGSS